MFGLGSSFIYQLYNKPCDMRKSFNGLSGLVTNELGRDPLKGEVFIFLNRHLNLIKLLHWESGGYVVYYKRLETGTFTRPAIKEGSTTIKWSDLVLMMEGIHLEGQVQKLRFKLEK